MGKRARPEGAHVKKTTQILAGLAAMLAASAAGAADGAHTAARAQRMQQAQAERDAEDVLAAVVRIKMTAVPNSPAPETQ